MPIPSKGAIITGTTANNTTALPVGTDGQFLMANSACATGLEWAAGPAWQVSALSVVDNTGTAVTPTSFACNWYRQTGPDTWEVCVSLCNAAGSGASAGSGDYCLLLPNSLCFNTSSGYGQQPYGGTSNLSYIQRSIPNWGNVGGDIFNSSQSQLSVIPYSATGNFGDTSCYYRLAFYACGSGSGPNTWSSSWFDLSNNPFTVNLCFAFRSA